jgi:hypothetical protein
MSVGSNLQEMENVVTKGAAPAEQIKSDASRVSTPGQAQVEDLGGPTPENYRSDDDSAKLRDPAKTVAQVKDVVNAKAVAAESAEEEEGEFVSEEETTEEEYVSEEETTEEEVVEEEVEEEFNIDEDVEALLQGEELSEEFQEKAKIIFESAIRSKVAEVKEQLQDAYEDALVEEINTIKESLVERVDSYLEYVADEWISDNQLAVEHGLKTEMTESFLVGMKQLFEDHYVTIPEEKYDVIESMVDKLDEMEGKLNEQIQRNVALNQRLAESVADVIFADVAEGLALSQKDKLASLAENVEFDSEQSYREKLVTLRESYFPTNTSAQRNSSENLSEETDYSIEDSVSSTMGAYLNTLHRVSKK